MSSYQGSKEAMQFALRKETIEWKVTLNEGNTNSGRPKAQVKLQKL